MNIFVKLFKNSRDEHRTPDMDEVMKLVDKQVGRAIERLGSR